MENKVVFISNNSIDDTLMIVPIILGEKIVGIVGFANKPKGYNKIDAEELNDILLALGQVMVARQDREQNYLIQKENLIQKKRIEHFIKYSSISFAISSIAKLAFLYKTFE
jgi:transcriptional regulator with GAF, ATPase, and Fis domain